jgi:hypothetical protein
MVIGWNSRVGRAQANPHTLSHVARDLMRALRLFLAAWGVLAAMGGIEGKGASAGTGGDAASTAPAPIAVLEKSSLPAIGRQETQLNIHRFGRFSISVESSQGTALQLIDRMAGPGETKGVAGEADGRIDLFLDQGAYKVIATGPEGGKGEARLSARPFRERNASPPMLVELRPVEDHLEDL